jgi:hypothetical protein
VRAGSGVGARRGGNRGSCPTRHRRRGRGPHAEVAPAETPGLGGLLALAIGVVVVAALYLAREVLIPVTLAVLLSFALAPLAGLLQRLRLGRVPSAVLAAAAALACSSRSAP